MRDGTEDVARILEDARSYLMGVAEDLAELARELRVASICIDVDDMYSKKMERVMGFSADLGVDR